MILPMLPGFIADFALGVLEAAVRWTVPFLLVWCATRAQPLSAAARHHFWTLLLAGLALLPLVQGNLPKIGVEKPIALTAAESAYLAGGSPPAPENASLTAPEVVDRGLSPSHVHPAQPAARPVPAPGNALPSPTDLLTWFWLGVAAVLLALRAVGQYAMWQLMRRAAPAPAPRYHLLQECLSRVGIRRRVRLLVSEEESVPMTWGFIRPVVLLPSSSANWSRGRLRRVLLHELAHVERGDSLVQLLTGMVRAIFWFHPGVWLASRALRGDAELACDDRVLQAEGTAIAYAEDLLGIARSLRPRPLAAGALSMAQPHGLEQRIRRILQPNVPRTLSRRSRILFTASVATLVLGAAAFDWTEVAERPGGAPADAEWLQPSRLADGRAAWVLDCGPLADPVCRDATRKALDLLERTGRTGAVVAQRVATGEVITYAAVRPAGSVRADAVPLAAPGSVAKLALAALWWESGMGAHTVPCPGRITLDSGREIYNVGRQELGPLPASEMLVASCNTAAATMTRTLTAQLGVDSVTRALAEAGFAGPVLDSPTAADEGFWGVDSERVPGWTAPPRPYLENGAAGAAEDRLVLAGLGIGGSATTPLHVSRFLQAVGNDGVMLTPRPIADTVDAGAAPRLLSSATAARMQDAMLRVVREGTAARAIPQLEWSSWALGGKTGTVPGSGAGPDGWFAGLAHGPEGRAEYTIVVFIEGGGMGGGAPAGIAAELTRLFGRAEGDEL